MKILRAMAAIAAAAFLGGCAATLEDFHDMPPEERAGYICERHWEARQIYDDLINAEGRASVTAQAIARGYRLHSACEFVPVTVTKEERCTTDKDGAKVCREVSEVSREEVCRDEPVAIDGRLEKEKLDGYRQEIRELQAEYDGVYEKCFAQTRAMSAE
ncbi:MAG: hypothetical protein ACR2P5_05910, partial [Gammaproteobacteria bacterium]